MTFFLFWGIIKRGIYMTLNEYLWKLLKMLVYNYFMINLYMILNKAKIYHNLQESHDEIINHNV